MFEDTQELTAPLAVIMVGGIAVGKMKGLRLVETLRRGRVGGLGTTTPQSVPVLEWNGTLTCSFYHINFNKTGIQGALNRNVTSEEEFINNVLLMDEGVDIVLYKKVKIGTTSIGTAQHRLVPNATIRGCFIDRQGMNVDEGQIAGQDQDFTYINPIIFPPQ